MKESEIIIVNKIPNSIFEQCFKKALEYAVLSLPFTYNRMEIKSIEKRISNILKGKLAEGLFQYFCIINNLGFDFLSCQTDFNQADKRDFIFGSSEWDLKNNFLNHIGEYWFGKYTKLPALIPDNSKYSQWKTRKKIKNNDLLQVAYVFSFMKLSSKYKGSFFDIQFSDKQIKFLKTQYQSVRNTQKIYNGDFFLKELGAVNFSIRKHPYLVITAYASHAEWHLFHQADNAKLIFQKGIFRTKILNQLTEIGNLPSFYQRFFKNNRPLKLATLKTK